MKDIMIAQNRTGVSNAPIYWLALGTFAVGAEGFMIAGILPTLAADLAVSASVAGQLVAAFALAYAISSPILTALSGSLNRRRLLIIAMSAFALANLFAWRADGSKQRRSRCRSTLPSCISASRSAPESAHSRLYIAMCPISG